MDREFILSKYKRPEDKLLISKFFDKVEITGKTNKISCTDFYNESEQSILKKVINVMKFENYVFFGGFENSERKLIVVYPEKMRALFESGNFKFDTVVSVFRIVVPKENKGFFNHSAYLGGIIKLGVKREKIGDIVVCDNTADVVVKRELEEFLFSNLKSLTRFSGAEIYNVGVQDIKVVPKQFKDIRIVTSSLRLDSVVAELAGTSRNRAAEFLAEERVLVNYECECKGTKLVKVEDIITIRGKGKFVVAEIVGNTRKGNFVVGVKQYV